MSNKAKVIAVMNNKGGVLKTTLVTNLAGVLVKQGKKVLIVDTDPQGNVSTSFGNNAGDYKTTLSEVIIDKVDVEKAIKKNVVNGLDIIPTNTGLNHFDPIAYSGKSGYADVRKVLQKVLQKVLPLYDYIIIDSAPYMNLMSINVIKVSDYIIVPSQMELFASKGMVDLISEVNELGGNIKAIIPTLFDGRTTIHKEMLVQIEQIAKKNKIVVTKTKITRSIQAANASAYERLPLTLTSSKSKQALQYVALIKELVKLFKD